MSQNGIKNRLSCNVPNFELQTVGAETQILSFHYTLTVKCNINHNDLGMSQNLPWEIVAP